MDKRYSVIDKPMEKTMHSSWIAQLPTTCTQPLSQLTNNYMNLSFTHPYHTTTHAENLIFFIFFRKTLTLPLPQIQS